MCKEAGCGCCAVTVTYAPGGDKAETMSINSCLCPLYSVDGWQITTVEGIGSQKDGFHPIQERIAKHNGTQCGYCTPGFVMSMYGLLHQKPQLSQQEIEDSFDGHVCRCTGYRSILDAMKSFATDSTIPGAKCVDIEDLDRRLCPKTGESCLPAGQKNCPGPSRVCASTPRRLAVDLEHCRWYRPVSLVELGKILQQHKTQRVRLVFGNTAAGIFTLKHPFQVYIDLRAVRELYLYKETDSSVTFGGGTTFTVWRERLRLLEQKPGYHYCSGILRHLKVFASVLAGCLAGNLMIKYYRPDFPSDLFTILEALGAKVKVFDSKTSKITQHTLLDFLRKVDMKGKIISSIQITSWDIKDHYRSFKITPRWQNAHAYINAAFKITIDNRKIIGQPNFVIGGINAHTIHAVKAEEFIQNKTLSDDVINETLQIMFSELEPSEDPILSSATYRRQLAVNLLYKVAHMVLCLIYLCLGSSHGSVFDLLTCVEKVVHLVLFDLPTSVKVAYLV
ncbi:uncharacterized protein LOC131954765 [Physella acuta]|uniref:uncharacterized protein LOC131954765 n=1 Tax=Physella acuta TaxID=109671 RepID=UPI0027DBA66A|nr:uncharacterized protein LOC131954765 [Physella acuta]